MRYLKIFVTLILLSVNAEAQVTNIADVYFSPTDTVEGAYKIKQAQPSLFISSGFGSSNISRTASLDSISGFRITEIVLVYSRYHKKEDFNQAALNQKRWFNLFQTYPSLFQNGTTTFKNICQDVEADTSAKKLTHGFYIYFENRTDSTIREKEIREISSLLESLGVDTSDTSSEEIAKDDSVFKNSADTLKRLKAFSLLRTKDPKACRQPFYGTGLSDLDKFFKERIVLTASQKRKPKELYAEVRLKLDQRGIIRNAYILTVNKSLIGQIKTALYKMDPWHPAVRDGKIIKTDVKFILQYSPEGKLMLKGGITVPVYLSKCPLTPDEELFDFSERPVKERTLASSFQVEDKDIVEDVVKRTPGLNNLLIVVDLTGSMGPYIAQVVNLMTELIEKNNPHVNAITLFNDGDRKPDKNKQIGSTGGITVMKDDITIEKLGKAILRTMKNGSGGDCMENNIEALIKGIKECPECNEIIMIADNFATPRDMSLIAEVKKPVHWIVCGAGEGINVHYLDLIRANVGVLHTAKSDVINLHLIKENEAISIDGMNYQLIRGKFKVQK